MKRPRVQSKESNRSSGDGQCSTPEFGKVIVGSDGIGIFGKLSGMLRPGKSKNTEHYDKENQRVDTTQQQKHVLGAGDADDHFDETIGKPRFALLPNLADAKLGARVIFVSDEYYGVASNILDVDDSDSRWETRRRRTAGHDWVLIQLAYPGIVKGLEVNVAGCDRNMAPSVSIEAGYFKDLEADVIQHSVSGYPMICSIADKKTDAAEVDLVGEIISASRLDVKSTFQSPESLPGDLIDSVNNILDKHAWDEILPLTRLKSTRGGSGSNFFAVTSLLEGERKVTHLRLNIFPDGSITKIKVFGEVRIPPGLLRLEQNDSPSKSLEVASVAKGGWVLHSTSARDTSWRLLSPQKCLDSEDGWVTPRQIMRPPIIFRDSSVFEGEESVVIKLATRCLLERIELHTHHIWGNFPAFCNVDVMDESEVAGFPWIKQMLIFSREERGQSQVGPMWVPIDGVIPMKPNDDNKVQFEHQQQLHQQHSVASSATASKQKIGRLSGTMIGLPSGLTGITHLRVRLRPDGALSRIRVYAKCANSVSSGGEAEIESNIFLPPMGGPLTGGPGQGRRFSIRRRQ